MISTMERYTDTPKLMPVAGGVGVLGLVLTAVGYFTNPAATAFSYLIAFVYWVGIAVATLIMLAIFLTAKARWPTILRRSMETMANTVPIFAVLFLGLIPMMAHLFPWLPGSELAKEFAPEELPHLAHKQHGYLNIPFFAVRQVIYFVVWGFVAYQLRKWSTRQDETGDVELLAKQRRFAPGTLPFLALTITFASFDWIMSLTPLWQSTIYGAYYFAGSFLAGFCVLTIATVNARGKNLYGNLVTTAHYHNLGKLLLAFTAFWAYIAFSQFLLMWIANLPEEVAWYKLRIEGPWRPVSLALFFLNFVLPFFTLLSRKIKLIPGALVGISIYLLATHWLDLYWLIWPAFSPSPSFHWTQITAFVGVGGVAVAYGLSRARGHYTLPVKDPYIADSLRYVQP